MQQILNVLTPAESQALLSVDEMKMALNIPLTDTSKDAQLALLIDAQSATIAKLANRVFGKEEVEETFFDINNNERRLYFSRWPVLRGDIESLMANGVDIINDPSWVLEETTGTLYTPPTGVWYGSVNAIYSGGYDLPDEAPADLKRACSVVTREAYFSALRPASLYGVHMVQHKQARVSFLTPTEAGIAATGMAGSPATWNAVQSVVNHYIRDWV